MSSIKLLDSQGRKAYANLIGTLGGDYDPWSGVSSTPMQRRRHMLPGILSMLPVSPGAEGAGGASRLAPGRQGFQKIVGLALLKVWKGAFDKARILNCAAMLIWSSGMAEVQRVLFKFQAVPDA